MTPTTSALFTTARVRTIAALALGASMLASTALAAPVAKPATPGAASAVGPASVVGPYSVGKAPVSVAKARAHQFKPAGAAGHVLASDHELPPLKIVKPKVFTKVTPKLDFSDFSDTLHAALKNKVRGYSMVVRKGNTVKANVVWDYAKSPSEGNKGWTTDTRMHIASISKLMTAITLVDVLDEVGVSVDAKIGPYLPDYWEVGENVADLTFRDVMRHRTGFSSDDGSFPSIKAEVARDVPANPKSDYANVNFALLRVLGATLSGWVPPSTRWDDEINDAMWDIAATQWLISRTNAKVLAPAGVAPMSPTPSGDSAYAYGSRTDDDGWNSGDVSTVLGGVGYRLSPNDVAKVMGTFRRGGAIVSEEVAKEAIEGLLGINGTVDTPNGRLYFRKGGWNGNGNTEQSVAFYAPDDVEIAVFVNSPIGTEDANLRVAVTEAYLASLK